MSFAMCLGSEVLFAILVFFLAVGAAVLALAVFGTVALAKWAAARQLKRLAADAR
jgi:hypothetical protein